MENWIFNVSVHKKEKEEEEGEEEQLTVLKNKTFQSTQIDKGHRKGEGFDFWNLELRLEDDKIRQRC